MAVLSGYLTKEELKQIKGRKDISILKQSKSTNKEWKKHMYVKLDCNWSIMELLECFGG